MGLLVVTRGQLCHSYDRTITAESNNKMPFPKWFSGVSRINRLLYFPMVKNLARTLSLQVLHLYINCRKKKRTNVWVLRLQKITNGMRRSTWTRELTAQYLTQWNVSPSSLAHTKNFNDSDLCPLPTRFEYFFYSFLFFFFRRAARRYNDDCTPPIYIVYTITTANISRRRSSPESRYSTPAAISIIQSITELISN